MQELDQSQINHSVMVILLQKIIELLDKEEQQPETLKADEVRAALRNELAAVVKAVKGIPKDDNTDIIKELNNLKKSFESIDFKPTINVAAADVTVPKIELPEIKIPEFPEFNIPTPQVNYTAPDIHVSAPTVNLPPPIVNVEATDLSAIIRSLEINLNKLRTNDVSRPLAVRLSDGQSWLKEIRTFADKAQQAFAAFPGSVRISNITELPQTDIQYATQIDDVSTTGVTYVGQASIGTSTNSPSWRIKKIDETGTPITMTVKYTGGGAFNQIWDNRTSLTYS